MSNRDLWWNGPEWLAQEDRWPPEIVTASTRESQAEAKATREIFAVAIPATDDLDAVLANHDYWKALRVCAWIMRRIRKQLSHIKGNQNDWTTNY